MSGGCMPAEASVLEGASSPVFIVRLLSSISHQNPVTPPLSLSLHPQNFYHFPTCISLSILRRRIPLISSVGLLQFPHSCFHLSFYSKLSAGVSLTLHELLVVLWSSFRVSPRLSTNWQVKTAPRSSSSTSSSSVMVVQAAASSGTSKVQCVFGFLDLIDFLPFLFRGGYGIVYWYGARS